ncbi:PDZ domain-containing protein [Anoxybacterium hadale]|uniref:PDZ domain-containing protein n=1 Tax=Anoxybacterium hadale TaxID=3408580 RepID=A0ACD1AEV3_9FIRM|nr:PDZ domain-containing protein [Clostridiales bacterium]
MDPYKARKIAKVIAFVVVITMLITSFSFLLYLPGLFGQGVVYAAAAQKDDELDAQLKDLKDYIVFIKENYKDDVAYQDLIQGAFEGVVYSLGDPYSIYYGNSGGGTEFVEAVSGEYSGIGLSVESYNGLCRVVAPTAGTPAEDSGIKAGDIITKIDGTDISSKTLDQAVKMMRGKADTKVTLTVDRNGQTLQFTITRAVIKNTSVNYKMLENNIGYIQITGFDNDSNKEFEAALAALKSKGLESLVLDVRNNPGGFINVTLDIADQLMGKGPIMHTESKGKILESYYADDESSFNKPIVLLVNEGSASASEILAGALKDSKVATLVGTNTFGKGVAQQVFGGNDELKLSMFYFLTPNKTRIDHTGITPDYIVQNSTGVDTEALTKEYLAFAPMSEKVKPTAGSTGLNVFGAQQRLSMLGYKVSATATMDDASVAAVKKFQAENGLYSCGVLDYTTMNKLDKAVIEYITGSKATEDLALKKAIELLK